MLKINQYLLYMRIWFIYFYADLFKRHIKTKFSLAFMKTLATLFRKRHPSEFFCEFSFKQIGKFSRVHVLGSFLSNFQNHRWLAEQILES